MTKKPRSPKYTCRKAKKVKRTQEEAIGAAIRLSATRGVPLRAYECEFCGTWHLTKQERRKRDGGS